MLLQERLPVFEPAQLRPIDLHALTHAGRDASGPAGDATLVTPEFDYGPRAFRGAETWRTARGRDHRLDARRSDRRPGRGNRSPERIADRVWRRLRGRAAERDRPLPAAGRRVEPRRPRRRRTAREPDHPDFSFAARLAVCLCPAVIA